MELYSILCNDLYGKIILKRYMYVSFPDGSDGKESACLEETQVQSLGWEDPLAKGMTVHSSILAWRIPWTEKPGRLKSMELQRVGHN